MTRKMRYIRMKAAPPYSPAMEGKRHTLPRPMAQPAEMRMKPRRLAKCSRGAATEVGASTLLPEARTGEAEGVSVVMGTFLVQDSRCFCIGLPSVLNEIAASL